ncbi:MAG TPA: glycosyltransferase family 2 protein [Candidatus Dormibacteraeota bacterium]
MSAAAVGQAAAPEATTACPHSLGGSAAAVAVVIPARDEAALIGRCLASVDRARAGTAIPVEAVVVVDDQSQDGTAAVAAAAGARVIRQEVRRGPLAAWQRGIEASTAPLVVLLDADCEVSAGALDELLAPFSEAGVGVVAGRSVALDEGGSARLPRRSARFSSLLLHQTKSRLDDHDFLPIGKLMAVRRAAWRVTDTTVAPCDRVVATLAQKGGWTVRYAPRAVVFYHPLTSFRELRSDYLRTNPAAAPEGLSHRALPRTVLLGAGLAALWAAPLDGLAWALCRVRLGAAGLAQRGRRAADTW